MRIHQLQFVRVWHLDPARVALWQRRSLITSRHSLRAMGDVVQSWSVGSLTCRGNWEVLALVGSVLVVGTAAWFIFGALVPVVDTTPRRAAMTASASLHNLPGF